MLHSPSEAPKQRADRLLDRNEILVVPLRVIVQRSRSSPPEGVEARSQRRVAAVERDKLRVAARPQLLERAQAVALNALLTGPLSENVIRPASPHGVAPLSQ